MRRTLDSLVWEVNKFFFNENFNRPNPNKQTREKKINVYLSLINYGARVSDRAGNTNISCRVEKASEKNIIMWNKENEQNESEKLLFNF